MRRAAALSLLFAVVIGGCTLPGSTPPSSAPPSPDATTAPATTAPTPSGSASTADLPVLASKKASFSGTPVVVSVNELVVRNGVTTVTWTVTNAQPAGTSGLGIQTTADFFGDGQIARKPGTDQPVPDDQYYVDGVYLLDTANKLRYLPARDSEGVCVCTYSPSSVFIRPGASQSFNNVFKGVPDGVGGVDVTIPRVATFRDIPVQR